MFENITNFLKKLTKKQENTVSNSKEAAKERLHLVLMQDRANVSADFLELMKQEIIEVIKKYIDVDESAIDVRLTNKENSDGTNGAPALYANIPILNIKNEARKVDAKTTTEEAKASETDKKEESKEQEKIEEADKEKEENNEEDKKEGKKKKETKKEDEEDNKEVKENVEKTSEETKEEIKSENK